LSHDATWRSITDLEAGVITTGSVEHDEIKAERAVWPHVEISQPVLDRAWEVQGLLASRSQHRGVKIPDLLIAATAEKAGLTVLHYDRDYDRIAEVTGQPTEWVVEAGAAD
jgi:predicted nucleic acid-binding protein